MARFSPYEWNNPHPCVVGNKYLNKSALNTPKIIKCLDFYFTSQQMSQKEWTLNFSQ